MSSHNIIGIYFIHLSVHREYICCRSSSHWDLEHGLSSKHPPVRPTLIFKIHGIIKQPRKQNAKESKESVVDVHALSVSF